METDQTAQPTVLHLFCGAGGGGLGFRRAGFRGVLALDNSEAACRDYERIVGEPATHADLNELSPAELRDMCPESPDVVFTSPPCKGFSGCLPEARSTTPHYLALNSLAFRGIWLALETWERPPRLILLENVPRIQSRGRVWLDQISALLRAYGYAIAETKHDCGVLGGLAQHRRRFLLVARHMDQVPGFLRVPSERRVRGIGEVLGELPVPLPGGTSGGPMHRLPRLSPMNWVRLALIPPGGDWRDIPESVRLPARGGRPNGPYGVEDWKNPSHAVLGHTTARDTWGSIADPRLAHDEHRGCRGVQDWEFPSKTIRASHNVNNAPAAVADPRLGCSPRAGTMGVEDWACPSHAIRAHYEVGNSAASIADPRVPEVEGPPIDISSKRPTYLVIRAADGTWHRPMTTLELLALQSFPTQIDGEWIVLDGRSHHGWRERVGNAVPPLAAEAIGWSCRATLLAAASGTWALDNNPIWVSRMIKTLSTRAVG